MYEFKNASQSHHGFNYIFEKSLKAREIIILKMPPITPNKRGINDIGWQADGDVTLYGTLSSKPETDTALWQEIEENHEVNKTISALKIVNSGDTECNVAIRVILN